MSLTSHLHRFYVINRQPSPRGGTSTSTRRKISKGEVKSGTTPLKKYDSTTDTVKEEQVENKQIQLNPGESTEETVQGATIRWTILNTGVEHTVAESITLKELDFLGSFATGATALTAIKAIVKFISPGGIETFDTAFNPVSADIETAHFITTLSKNPNTPLKHLFEVIFERDHSAAWTETELRGAVNTFALANLPPHVTIS